MRRWWMVLILPVMFAMLAAPLEAAWLKNLAMFRLQTAWNIQQKAILDPSCDPQWKSPAINKYLEASAAIAPPNPSALTHLGQALWLEGDCTKAASLWEQASRYDYAPAEYELMRIGDFTTFSTELRARFAVYAFNQGEVLDKSKQYQATSRWYNRSFELVPDYVTVEALIRLHQKTGDAFDASSMWRKMVDNYPDTVAEHWYALGELDNLNSNWESAARAFTKGAGLTTNSYYFWLNAGNAWVQVKNWEQALGCFERANQLNPDYLTAYLSLGDAYTAQQEYQAALNWYLRAVKLFPLSSEPFYHLGETFFAMGDYAQARRNLMAALVIYPTDRYSMFLIARTYYQDGNHSLADSWMVNAINNQPIPQLQGQWWLQLGNWRLEWHNCSGAQDAYTIASNAGVEKATISEKLITLAEVCNP